MRESGCGSVSSGVEYTCVPEEKLEQEPHHLDNSRVNQGEGVLDGLKTAVNVIMTC